MNEPIIGGDTSEGWLAGELGGNHFVQRLTLDPKVQALVAEAAGDAGRVEVLEERANTLVHKAWARVVTVRDEAAEVVISGLEDEYKLNIEANHATLAGHTFAHDLRMAADAGLLGSIDANRGDPQNGWDTDQFPLDLYDCVHGMMEVLKSGGLGSGGLNFDAKVRRNSFDEIDTYYAHIGGMDTFARGLQIAAKIRETGELAGMVKDRYASWDSGVGTEIEAGAHNFASLEKYMLEKGDVTPNTSGRQELFENMLNEYI